MHFLDIFIVVLIVMLACAYLANTFVKIRRNRCATMCGGCSGDGCSTKNFATEKSIKLYRGKL